MTVRFSVVLPVYNAEAFFERALISVQSQTYPVHEILIVDDHSTDNTYERVRAAIQSEPRARLLQTERNGGPSVARNRGILEATGNWIAVLDADDAYTSERCARIARLIAADARWDVVADDLVYFDMIARQETGRTNEGRDRQGLPVDLVTYLRHNLAAGDGVDWGLLKPVFRRDFLCQHSLWYPPGVRHGEDFAFMVSLLSAGAKFTLMNSAGYLYTQREGAVSRRASGVTRTEIAYAALARSAEELANTPSFATNPTLRSLAQRRADGLMRLDDADFFSRAARQKDVRAIVARMYHRPGFIWRVMCQVRRAVWRRFIRH